MTEQKRAGAEEGNRFRLRSPPRLFYRLLKFARLLIGDDRDCPPALD